MSTKPQIRTGTDDFADLLLESNVWVDKSLFIKEFLEDSGKVTLITRPRRWGKSLNLDMLRRFLSLEIDAKGYPLPKEECFNDKLFAGGEVVRETGERKQLAPLKIAQHQHLMATYQGRYPVICLGLKNVKGSSYQAIFLQIKKELSTLFKTHSYLLASHRVAEDEKLLLKRYMREEGSVVDVTRSIGFLSELMHKHFQKPVYILVDEYDTPINHAYLKLLVSSSAFDDVLDLFRQFFGATFKTNPYLAKGLITGILRIAKANIFSDLNNVREYTLLDEEFASFYGFTQSEVDVLLNQVPTQTPAAEIKAWYNGYTLGGEVIYNPWSIMCCLSRKGKLAPYWIDSGGTSLVDDKLLADEMQADLQKLVARDVIESPIITQISFDDLKKRSGLLSLLLFSGYLNPVQRLGNAFNAVYHLSIPNQEVQCVYEMRVLEWVSKQLAIDTDRYFSFAHLLAEGKIDAFKDVLQQYLHNATSFHQTGEKSVELFYSGFMLGLLSILSTYYSIYSEQEGLKGRSDALLVPKPNHGTEALVLEYKVSPKADQLAAVAERGVSQILQKGYAQPAQQHAHVKSVLAVCLAFSGKEVFLAQRVAFTR